MQDTKLRDWSLSKLGSPGAYTILYYTILYYTILYYTILYYTILYHTILYYTILYYTISRLSTGPYGAFCGFAEGQLTKATVIQVVPRTAHPWSHQGSYYQAVLSLHGMYVCVYTYTIYIYICVIYAPYTYIYTSMRYIYIYTCLYVHIHVGPDPGGMQQGPSSLLLPQIRASFNAP